MSHGTKRYKIGLLIGRFQPFHNGHLYLIKEVLKKVDRLLIGIGSSNVHNGENPLNYKQRRKMIEMVFEKEGLKDKLIRIVSIPDVPDDDEWLRIALAKTGKFDVVIGNNEWTNGIFEKAGFTILRVPYYKRNLYEGKQLRKRVEEGRDISKRIPSYLMHYLKTL